MKSNNSYTKNSTERIQGGVKMKSYLLITTILITGLFARATEPATGWFYDQSTLQVFYMLETLTIDDAVAEGDGSGAPPNDGDCYTSGACDVVGAFIDRDGVETCVGWVYADASANVTTVPLMGADGSDATGDYLLYGESASLKVYDASNGSILSVYLVKIYLVGKLMEFL